jgi:hypothetical protein
VKKLFTLGTLFSLFLLIFGCSQEMEGNSKDSYAIIVVINEKEYNFYAKELGNNLEMGKHIGTIQQKTKPNEMPGNLESNYYEAGTKIYEVIDNDDLIITVDKSNNIDVLKSTN